MAYESLPQDDIYTIITSYDATNERGLITTVAQSGKVQTKRTGVQRHDFKITVSIFGYQNIKAFQAFLNRNIDTPFWVSLPAYQVNHTSNATVSASTAVMASAVQMSGFSGTIPAGAFFQFVNHSKVYQLMYPINGSSTATIHPPLRQPVTIGEGVNFKDVKFLVKQTEGTLQTKIDTVDWVAEITLEVKEAF